SFAVPACDVRGTPLGRARVGKLHPSTNQHDGASGLSRYVLGMRVDGKSFCDVLQQVAAWARNGESRYVCVSNVHMVMEAYDSSAFQRLVNAADLVTPDGMPLVWALRLLGVRSAERVCGPELTPALLEVAERESIPVGFY